MPGRALALCPSDDDGDGYGDTTPPGCPAAVDCDDADPAVHPAAFETLGNLVDDDCNGGDALRIFLAEGIFASFAWPGTGWVNYLPDGVKVGNTTVAAEATVTRTLNFGRPWGGTGVMVDVTAASGSTCEIRLTTGPYGGGAGPTTTHGQAIPGDGTRWLAFTSIGVPYNLKKIQVWCPANESVTLDWLSIQDSNAAFPPPAEMTIDWQDIRAPGGGFTTTTVRDDASDWIYMGTDVAGLARYDVAAGGPWEVANGTGTHSLFPYGVIGIADVLPMEDGGDDLYVLTGDVDENGAHGGLWHSPDNGDTWISLGTSWDDDAYPTARPQNGTGDDVAGYTLLSNCPGNHFELDWQPGGGRHLQGDAYSPAWGDVIYIANEDEDARGVSIWDGTSVCPLPNTGTPLPADHVGALLRVDVEPNGSPVLVVGYRGRVDGGAGLFVCDLPVGGPSCALPPTPADCWEVIDPVPALGDPADLLAGLDVRDFELDVFSEQVGETAIWVADGGDRPEDSDGDGIGDVLKYDTDGDGVLDAVCTSASSRLDALVLDDSAGSVVVVDYDDYADSSDMPELAHFALTGIGMSPGGEYLVANVPPTGGSDYWRDRAYRADPADILAGIAVWEALNSNELPTVASDTEDWYETIRHFADTDFSGAWLEAVDHGTPSPFPARYAPGTAADTLFLRVAAGGAPAVMGAGVNAWLVENLTAAWTDNELDPDAIAQPEGDVKFTFWPDINDDGRHSYQTTVVHEVAIDHDGEIYSAAGDIGPMQLDATEPFDPFIPVGAQVDCLWRGWHAGGASVSVGLDNSLWLALLDQDVNEQNPYAHNMGVLRSLDHGGTWLYAAAGWEDAGGDPVMNVYDPGGADERVCQDNDSLARAYPFPRGGGNAAHAFSTNDGNPLLETSVDEPSFGNPREVRGLNRQAAMVLFAPYYSDTLGAWATDGGLHATVNGGAEWLPVDFDGDWAGDGPDASDCDPQESYLHGYFEFVHPGTDTFWEGDLEVSDEPTDFMFDLVYSVTLGNLAPYDATSGTYPCALARVGVGPDGAGGLTASWEWIPLTSYNDDDFDGVAPDVAGACGVTGLNIARLSVPAWSDEAVIWGDYTRSWQGGGDTIGNRQGGACVVDLDSYATTMMVNPTEHEYGIGYVAPHPDVADVFAVLPVLDMGTWHECYKQRKSPSVDPQQERCPDFPWPMIARRDGSTFALTTLSTMAPSARPFHAVWSHIGVPDDSIDGSGSWLVMGTSGSGAWRGEVTW